MQHSTRDAILFSLPFLLVYLAFLVFPIFYGMFLSLFDWNILSGKTYIGLRNYMDAFRDDKFRSSLLHTCQFVLISTPTIIFAGFLMALASIRPSKLGKASETLFFLPYVFSTTVIGTLWGWIFQKNFGLVNQLLKLLGTPGLGWLTDPKLAMATIAGATLWWTAGFNMILFSAGMKQIPDEIFESARLDGASSFTILFKITIPLLRDTTILVVILQLIASFKVFGQSYVMTGGGPYGTTRVLVQYVYETGFSYFKMGYASAMSMLLFLVILAISAFQYFSSQDEQ
ncbi:MAG: sugar ABC transporter permease [Rectinemataceae bacterium]|jgi:multiple sugar transport system permease protein